MVTAMITRKTAISLIVLALAGCAGAPPPEEPGEIARRIEALLTHQGRLEQAVCLDRGLPDGTREHARCLIREAERSARLTAATPTITRRLPPHMCWNAEFALALRCYDI